MNKAYYAILATMSTISISKNRIQKQKGVVVLPIKEYRRLLVSSVPEIYLTGNAAKRLDKLVAQGLKEHREGKTRKIRSLADLD